MKYGIAGYEAGPWWPRVCLPSGPQAAEVALSLASARRVLYRATSRQVHGLWPSGRPYGWRMGWGYRGPSYFTIWGLAASLSLTVTVNDPVIDGLILGT